VDTKNNSVQITQQNNYPWDGHLSFTVDPKRPAQFNLMLRIPGWARNIAMPSTLYRFENASSPEVIIKVNGQPVQYKIENGYAVINRTWKKNDVAEVDLPMEIKKVVANENLKEDIGKMVLQRGPIIYCAEGIDNEGRASNIIIPSNASFTSEYKADMLNGITVLKSEVPKVLVNNEQVLTVKQPFTAIPYYAWANRGKNEMMVWFPQQVKDIDIITK
jgi:DUF1680 family protein